MKCSFSAFGVDVTTGGEETNALGSSVGVVDSCGDGSVEGTGISGGDGSGVSITDVGVILLKEPWL